MIFLKIKSVSKKSVILMEFDWVLFIATICLSVFGIVMIYSATRTLQSNTNVIVQSGAMVIGCAAMLVRVFRLRTSLKISSNRFIYSPSRYCFWYWCLVSAAIGVRGAGSDSVQSVFSLRKSQKFAL